MNPRTQSYLTELGRSPYYSRGPIQRPGNLQAKIRFEAAAEFESEQRRLFFEKRSADLLEEERNCGDTDGNVIKKSELPTYIGPGGSLYFAPDGLSQYIRP